MNIQFDDNVTIGEDNVFLITSVEGLGPVEIRTSSFLYSGRSGGKVTKQLRGMRQVTIEGLIKSNNCDDHADDRRTFEESLEIDQSIPVHITMFSGDRYLMYAHPVDVTLSSRSGGKTSDYKIELLSGDPLLYEESEDPNIATVENAQSGGFEIPFVLPVIFEPGEQPTEVENFGNSIVYPTIYLYDEGSDPIITNMTTGEVYSININMIDGDIIKIDMLNRTLTLNDGNILGNMDSDSVWWGLVPGVNQIKLNTGGATDPMYAEIQWRNGYSGA